MTLSEEEMALDKLLSCSEKYEPYERYIKVHSLDEIVLGNLSPQCAYMSNQRERNMEKTNEKCLIFNLSFWNLYKMMMKIIVLIAIMYGILLIAVQTCYLMIPLLREI